MNIFQGSPGSNITNASARAFATKGIIPEFRVTNEKQEKMEHFNNQTRTSSSKPAKTDIQKAFYQHQMKEG